MEKENASDYASTKREAALNSALCVSGIMFGISSIKKKKYSKAVINFLLAAISGCSLVSNLSQNDRTKKCPKNAVIDDTDGCT